MKKILLVAVIVLLVTAGGGWWYCQKYCMNKTANAEAAAPESGEPSEAAQKDYQAAREMKDGPEKVMAYDALLVKYGPAELGDLRGSVLYRRAMGYLALESRDEAALKRYLDEAFEGTKGHEARGFILNSIAWNLAEADLHMDVAETWAREALTVAESDKDDETLAQVHDTLAYILQKQGKGEDAHRHYSLSIEKDPSNTEILARASANAAALGRNEQALDWGLKAVSAFGVEADDEALAGTKALYTKVRGSDKGFDAELAKAREEARRWAIFDSRAVQGMPQAADWNLPGMDGTQTALASMRGRAVLVKFWGFW